jgi:hypothetical protein
MMDIVERLGSLRLSNQDYEVVVDAIDEIERLREVRDQLQAINGAKDKEIAILRAEKHLTALKEGE